MVLHSVKQANKLAEVADLGGAGVGHAPSGHTDGHESRLLATVRTQTIKIPRLFWHSKNVSFKVVRKAILTAGIAEKPAVSRAPLRTR